MFNATYDLTKYSCKSWHTGSENVSFIAVALIVFELWLLKGPIGKTFNCSFGQLLMISFKILIKMFPPHSLKFHASYPLHRFHFFMSFKVHYLI